MLQEHLGAVILLLDIASEIDDIVKLIEFLLLEEAENYKLEQINVIADSRNNKTSDMKNGKYIIDIYYKHKMCFNTTYLSFTIERQNYAFNL